MSVTTLFADRSVPRPDDPPRAFACRCTHDGSEAAWVHVSGELDLATSPVLARLLGDARHQARLVVIDLRALDFIDTSGLHVILDAAAEAHERGDRMTVVRGSPDVDRMFTATGASGNLELVDLGAELPAVQVLLHLAEPPEG